MPSLAIQNSELRENIAQVIGVGPDPDDNWDDDTYAAVDRAIRAGRRKFFLANNWMFLENDYQFITDLPVTLTASCANGVVTVTSGTIPAAVVGYYKVVPQGAVPAVTTDSVGVYDIAIYDTANQFTLADTSANFTPQSIKLYKYAYDLPAAFAAFVDPVIVENWQDGRQLSEYATLPEFQVMGPLNRHTIVTGPPEIFCVSQSADAETGDFSFFIQLYPFQPTDTNVRYVIKSRIKVQPGDALNELGDVFHPVFSELMQEFILAQAELMFKHKPGVHSALVSDLLPAAIKRDREMRGTRRLLPRETRRRADNLEIRRAEINLSAALTS